MDGQRIYSGIPLRRGKACVNCRCVPTGLNAVVFSDVVFSDGVFSSRRKIVSSVSIPQVPEAQRMVEMRWRTADVWSMFKICNDFRRLRVRGGGTYEGADIGRGMKNKCYCMLCWRSFCFQSKFRSCKIE